MRARVPAALAFFTFLAACEPPKPIGAAPRESASPEDSGDPSGVDSGDTDSGDTDSGDTDSGDTDSGGTDSGDSDTDSGDTDSGDTDSGDTDTDSGDTGTDPPEDADGDGVPITEDCDDGDPARYPGATEICLSGVDEDCDGTGEGCVAETWSVTDDALELGTGEAGDLVGRALATGLDATGDGVNDLLVGAPGSDLYAADGGAVYLLAGPLEDLASVKGAALAGVRKLGGAGSAVALGDLDADGVGDLVVGAELGMADADGGRAYVVYGPVLDDSSLKLADLCIDLEGSAEALAEVEVGADWTGDGLPEILLSSTTGGEKGGGSITVLDTTVATGTEGACYQVGEAGATRASAEVVVYDSASSEDDASHVAQRGDMDGDGVHELRIGAPGHNTTASTGAGLFYVTTACDALNCSLGDSSSYDFRLKGSNVNEYLGLDSATGDLDGDGYTDMAVGAPGDAVDGAAPGGAVYLFAGGARFSSISGLSDAVAVIGDRTDGSAFGRSLSGGSDVNGDGSEDLLVTSSGDDDAGAAYLYLGPISGTLDSGAADALFTHPDRGAGLGHTRYAGPGADLNADGLDDVLLGADHAAEPSASGAVYLFSGAPY